MYKRALFVILVGVLTYSVEAYQVRFVNLTGTNWTVGTNVTVPPGETVVQVTPEYFNRISNAVGNASFCWGRDYVVGPGLWEEDLTSQSAMDPRNLYAFKAGFVLVFVIGFAALGARWVKVLIAGGSVEE